MPKIIVKSVEQISRKPVHDAVHGCQFPFFIIVSTRVFAFFFCLSVRSLRRKTGIRCSLFGPFIAT